MAARSCKKGSSVSRVLILGCGPAGVAAAVAAVNSGHQAVIVSKTARSSSLYGCQYLHEPIPGYEDVPSVRVSYRLNGTPEDYRRKVYGNLWQGKVSPEDFIGEHDAWDIRETYERMWNDYIFSGKVRVNVQEVANGTIPVIQQWKPDHIISTIPAPALCYKKHRFNSHSIWANGSTTVGDLADNSIVCDGTPEVPWYRISNVFGYRTAEWVWRPQERVALGFEERIPAVCVLKPLSTTCDCHPSVMRVGRYGTWSKGYLVHQVYPQVMKALS
jgi:hypothetical protein